MARLKDFKAKVLKILADHPKARNNDGTLMAHFVQKHCSHLIFYGPENRPMLPLDKFQFLPPFESIRRVRAIIQNENELYQPTDPAVRKARRIKEVDMRNFEVREAINYYEEDRVHETDGGGTRG